MDIYIVQPGDDINFIAAKYGVSVGKLIRDNELENPEDLVPGQTIVIVYPQQTHTVQEGDSLDSIAETYGVTLMQLLRNNPFLSNRKFIYPGETITISYNTGGKIITNGFAYPFIKRDTLLKILPCLTYLTIFNYRAAEEGEVTSYYDDSEVIQIAKNYGVAPLMMITTLTPLGEPNIEIAYNILLNEGYQDKLLDKMLNIVKTKGYYGTNMIFNYMNTTNQALYQNFIKKASSRFISEGYQFYATINPNMKNENNEVIFEKVDYSVISQIENGFMFLQFIWGTNIGPPSPVSNMNNLRVYIEYATSMILPDKIILGMPIISYDWQLPYIPGKSNAYSLSVNSAIDLAKDVGATIQFDDISQTPFFEYNQINIGIPSQHIVWSIDARSIDALVKIVKDYNLAGIGIWNVMIYSAQLWLIINSQYEIEKI